GKPDLVFTARRKVIFVHGCFWHQHNKAKCLDGRRPKSNSDYWDAKLTRNVERDQQHIQKLTEMGWDVLTLWDCEIQGNLKLLEKIRSFLGPSRSK
ncbi:MAG: very short patch repair endonuclease, partial [Sphingopyxis sp.]